MVKCNLLRINMTSHFNETEKRTVYNNMSYIILETKINFQNAVTFVLVKLDTKFKCKILRKTSLTILLNFNIFLTI